MLEKNNGIAKQEKREQVLMPEEHFERIIQHLPAYHSSLYTEESSAPSFEYFFSHSKCKELVRESVSCLIFDQTAHITKNWEKQKLYRNKKKDFETLEIAYNFWKAAYMKLQKDMTDVLKKTVLREVGIGVRLWYDSYYLKLNAEEQYGMLSVRDFQKGKYAAKKYNEWIDTVPTDQMVGYKELLAGVSTLISAKVIASLPNKDLLLKTVEDSLYEELRFRIKLPLKHEKEVRDIITMALTETKSLVREADDFLYWIETFFPEEMEQKIIHFLTKEKELLAMQRHEEFLANLEIAGTQTFSFELPKDIRVVNGQQIFAEMHLLYRQQVPLQETLSKHQKIGRLALSKHGELTLSRHSSLPLEAIFDSAGLIDIYDYCKDAFVSYLATYLQNYEKMYASALLEVQSVQNAYKREIDTLLQSIDKEKLQKKLITIKQKYFMNIPMIPAHEVSKILSSLGIQISQGRGDHSKGKSGAVGMQQRPLLVNDDAMYGKKYITNACRDLEIPLEYFMGVMKNQFSSKEIAVLKYALSLGKDIEEFL